eukprot:gene1055-626_t
MCGWTGVAIPVFMIIFAITQRAGGYCYHIIPAEEGRSTPVRRTSTTTALRLRREPTFFGAICWNESVSSAAKVNVSTHDVVWRKR